MNLIKIICTHSNYRGLAAVTLGTIAATLAVDWLNTEGYLLSQIWVSMVHVNLIIVFSHMFSKAFKLVRPEITVLPFSLKRTFIEAALMVFVFEIGTVIASLIALNFEMTETSAVYLVLWGLLVAVCAVAFERTTRMIRKAMPGRFKETV